MERRQKILFILLLLSFPQCECRRGGASSSRGISAARTSVSSPSRTAPSSSHSSAHASPRTNTAIHPTTNYNSAYNNGYNTRYNSGYNNPYMQPHVVYTNSRNGSPSRSSSFTSGLLGGATGALGGILAYQAGKAIIRSATAPIRYDGRDYYWDNYQQPLPSEIQCSVPLSTLQAEATAAAATDSPGQPITPSTTYSSVPQDSQFGTTTYSSIPSSSPLNIEQTFNTLQFEDGTRPKQVTWTCNRGFEQCCGMDCCRVA